MTPEEIAALVDAAAEGPASASVDGRSGTQHNLKDLIAFEKHRKGEEAAASTTGFGVRFFQTRPPGAA